MKVALIWQDKKKETIEEVEFISLPAYLGEVGILNNHAPFITILKKGKIKIKKENNVQVYTINGGFAKVEENDIIILIH